MSSEPRALGGNLVLVVGPSGAGKDTLMRAARERLGSEANFSFPRRVITRIDDTHEHHKAVSESEFEATVLEGGFLLHWRAHGHGYGIPATALDDIARGCLVVINVSRAIVADVVTSHASVRTIHVTAGKDILKARLIARGRESAEGIAARLERAEEFASPLAGPWDEVRNDGSVDAAKNRFVALLEHYAAGIRTS